MKNLCSLWYYFILVCFVSQLTACTTTKITMVDASVPKSEQSLIVVLDAAGGWEDAMLVYMDEKYLEAPGSLFYIPSGLRTLLFDFSSSSIEDTDYEYHGDRTTFTRITTTEEAEFKITESFLPGHTYRLIMRNATNIRLEDISDSVNWRSPQQSFFSPRNGVLTNFAQPRGLYVRPAINTGPYLQYTHQFDGKKANITGRTGPPEEKLIFTERGFSGLSPVLSGLFLQGGLDFGLKKFGITTMAEINGGIGFGGDLHGIGYSYVGFNWGYLFVAEIYYLNVIGVGFGYGKTSMAYFPDTTVVSELPAYDYEFPYLRGELKFFPKIYFPITVYSNYFFEQDKWAFGILINFAKNREPIFSGGWFDWLPTKIILLE